MPIEPRWLWNAFLEQQRRRLEHWIGLESLLHWTVQEQIGEREKAHALMMCHERPYNDA